MTSKFSHAQNVLESKTATVTSGGHWFNATRETVKEFVPGLLKKQEYESLVMKAVIWIESADSITLILFFLLVFLTPTWFAAGFSAGFYFFWYYNKSAFVNIFATPVLNFLNYDAVQIGVAALSLSLLGIQGNYSGLVIGLIFFFLFKVGLLRLLMGRIEAKRTKGITLNDRVLKMILIRYSIYEDVVPAEISSIEDHLKDAFLKFKQRKNK